MFKINDEVKFALPMIVLSTATNNKKCQTNKVVVTWGAGIVAAADECSIPFINKPDYM